MRHCETPAPPKTVVRHPPGQEFTCKAQLCRMGDEGHGVTFSVWPHQANRVKHWPAKLASVSNTEVLVNVFGCFVSSYALPAAFIRRRLIPAFSQVFPQSRGSSDPRVGSGRMGLGEQSSQLAARCSGVCRSAKLCRDFSVYSKGGRVC